MSNETISVPREDLEFALGFKCHGYKSVTEQIADQKHAADKLRALLAHPSELVADDRHSSVKALHDVMQAVPSSSLYSMAEAVLDAGYTKAAQPQGEPVPFGWWRVPKGLPLQGMFLHYTPGQSENDIQNARDNGFAVERLYIRPAEQPASVTEVTPADLERERLMEIVEQYPNVDPFEYDAAVRTLRK